jgi:hypothetical protein
VILGEYKNEARPLTLGILLMLAGCQSTGIVPTSQDSYYIGKKDGSQGLGVSLGNKAAVYREADTFCRQKGLEVKTLNESVIRQRRPDDSASL